MGSDEKITMLKPAATEPAAWAAVQDYVPSGFLLNAKGVFRDRGDGEFICGPCWVACLTRSVKGTDWSSLLHWIDQDGREQSAAFPARKLVEGRSSLVGDLAALGLKIVPGKERYLQEYLAGFGLPAEFRRRSAAQVGWLGDEEGTAQFVLPDRTIGRTDRDTVVFQPEEHTPSLRGFRSRESLEGWNEAVAWPCRGNPLMVFSLCCAFAAPLLKFAELDSGGFHLYGASSKGKTTALQVAASVWGSGADPAVAVDSYIGRWNTTGNALEATAAAYNDCLLTLDELGTCDARDIGKVVYDLLGGQSKRRLNRNSTLQAQRTWRIFVLSAGEDSVRQKIEASTGRVSKTGQLVRLADIPISQGIITDSHGDSPDAFVNRLKTACSESYGTAGPAFLEALLELYPSPFRLRKAIQAETAEWEQDLCLGKTLESHQRRVIRRFAVVVAGGLLATRLGILGLPEIEITQAIMVAKDAWLNDESNKTEGERGVEALREAVLRNPNKFQELPNGPALERALYGYKDLNRSEPLYLFTPNGFAEACGGCSVEATLDELVAKGYLHTPEAGRKQSKHTVPEAGRVRLYAVHTSFIEGKSGNS